MPSQSEPVHADLPRVYAQTAEEYPGVETAYPLAIASYETLLKRIDAQEARAQSLLTFGTAVTVAAPALATARGVHLDSPWFFAALALFALGSVVGLYGRLSGDVYLIDPGKVFEQELGKSEWQFKKDAIYFAGENYTKNNALILRRHKFSVAMTLIYLLEAVALALALALAQSAR